MTDNEAIEAAARAILLAETEDDMGLLCDQLTEWEAYHAARAAAPVLMEEGARLALEAAAELITPGRIEHSHHAGCSCVYCEGWRDVHAIQALDPAAIVKGAGHDRD